MANVKWMALTAFMLLITACGKAGTNVAFSGEEGASALRSNGADLAKEQGGRPEEGKLCESEEELRLRGAEEFVCLYSEFNYKGQACCIQRPEGAKLVQVPDDNPRSKRTGSLVHHGFKASLGVSYQTPIRTELELECITRWNPHQGPVNPACAKSVFGISLTFGIYGAIDRLASWAEDGGPLQLFGVKTLIFE